MIAMAEAQLTAGELDTTHIAQWFTVDAPHYPFPMSGELKRVEHFTPAKGKLTYTAWVYENPEEPEESRLMAVERTIKADKATSIILGHIGLTVPSETLIGDYVVPADEES